MYSHAPLSADPHKADPYSHVRKRTASLLSHAPEHREMATADLGFTKLGYGNEPWRDKVSKTAGD